MELILLLRYLAARLRHRDPFVVTYLKMGLGIEHRARIFAPFWADHFQRTRAAQTRWALHAHGECLTVLGAGRLLDFNRTALLPRFQKLRLVDADPLCRPAWKQLPNPVEAVCVDISNCLAVWLDSLRATNLPWAETMDMIRQFRAPAAYAAPGDALLSLNILSQLQIVWQDGVEQFLHRRFSRPFVERREAEWLDALRPAGQTLVEQHLAAMESAAPAFILLITDLEYLEYQGQTFHAGRWEPAPVEWSLDTGWIAKPGITCEVSPALEGVQLNEETIFQWLPSYRVLWQESWLWHIAPLGTEKGASGKVHRVGALALRASRLPAAC